MGLGKSLTGTVRVEITTASISDLITAIQTNGLIFMNAVAKDDLVLIGEVLRRDYDRLKGLIERRGEDISYAENYGLFWKLRCFIKRPVLMIGLCLMLILTLYIPTRILFFRVEGNFTIPDNRILECAVKHGIYFGASRNVVRNEDVKNGLLGAIPELQWACVNTRGCVAIISVRERPATTEDDASNAIGSIIAKRDAVIDSITVTSGNPLCSVGQAVCANQVLVSSHTDCGTTIKTVRASAEIRGMTSYDIDTVTPENYELRNGKNNTESRYCLKVGKKLIKLYKGSGISGIRCVKMYKEIPVSLPGGFLLPISLIKETRVFFETQKSSMQSDNWYDQFGNQTDQYLLAHMVAGEIVEKSEAVQVIDGYQYRRCKYICKEMIGAFRREEIVRGNE